MVEHEPERMIDEALAGGSISRTPSISISDRDHHRGEDEDEDAHGDDDDDDDDEDHDQIQIDGHYGPDDSRSTEWSRSPSPTNHTANASSSRAKDKAIPPLDRPSLKAAESTDTIMSEDPEGAEDAGGMNAEDMVEEQDDYARFLANIKNRDLNEVRTEIDDEIRILNGQNKVAMRDSDEITLAMIAQIQVRRGFLL